MIKLFNYKENNFNSNGIATIQPLTLMEYKETSLNGWHIETEIPIKYNDLIKEGMIALVETKSKGAQPFLISNITKTTKTLHFVAKHYVFDSINYVLEDVRPTNMSAAGALKYINDRTDIKSPFTTNSNVSATNTAYFINKNMLEALDTIQERWGGVYDVDKFHINLKNKVGIDRGDTIMYGKNLEGLKVFEDWSNVVTKLLPVGFDGITLPEKFLYSEIDYGKPYTKVVRFETELEDEERTEEALIQELRANALEYLKENEVPKLSYEVESNINQRLGIGDTIHVKHPVVDILTEVIAYEYNVLTKRVTKITFGNYKRSVKKKVDSIKNSIKEMAEKTNDFETIINDQTNIINDMNKKGHVYVDDNQIMVLDKIPKETAKHVWRWNMGGLGYSENGIEGPFKQAWTIDGKFNTEFIAANSIITNQLHASVGSSLDISSNESINLLTQKDEELENELTHQTGRLNVAYDKIESNVTETGKVKDRVTNTEKQLATHSTQITQTAKDLNAVSSTVNSQGEQIAKAQIQLDGVQGNVTINANNIKNKIDKGKAAQDINSGTVAINANRIVLNGHVTANGNVEFTRDGEIKANAGKIGDWIIASGRLVGDSAGGKFTIANDGNAPRLQALNSSGKVIFQVDREGKLTANNADITGTVTANAGYIGGWSILYGRLIGENSGGKFTIANDGSSARLEAQNSSGKSIFRVDREGKLYAESATIIGNITATSGSFTGTVTANAGKIGDWVIENGRIVANNAGGKFILGNDSSSARVSMSTSGGTEVFRIDREGRLTATSATIKGQVTAESGYIGNWSLVEGRLIGEAAGGQFVIANDSNSARISARNANGVEVFRIDRYGGLMSTSANIKGSITATSGTFTGGVYASYGNIGNYTISNGSLVGNNVRLHSNSIVINGTTMQGYDSGGITTSKFHAIELQSTLLSASRLTVTGDKNAIVPTRNGIRGIHAYETAVAHFGDIGEVFVECKEVVEIDPLFGDTIHLDDYHVFLTSYSDAYVWVENRTETSFEIHSDKPTQVSWEIKGVRRGYKNKRMPLQDMTFTEYGHTVGDLCDDNKCELSEDDKWQLELAKKSYESHSPDKSKYKLKEKRIPNKALANRKHIRKR